MTNSEKVIKGLKQHKDGWLHSCDNCPYASDANCQFKLYFDALTLIEEQKAIIEQYHMYFWQLMAGSEKNGEVNECNNL